MPLEQPRNRVADIARQAGVSPATVSRVLNDKPGVSGDKRQSVFGALDVLGIERPQRRRRPAGLVGLVTPELDNPIFPHFAQLIGASLAQHGYTPVLCAQTPGGVTEDEFVELLIERSVAGIVFVSGLHADTTTTPDRYQKLVARGLPIVLINGFLPDVAAPFFSCDDTAAGWLAAAHLVSLGHRRIGFVSGPERFLPVQRKLAGYRDALHQNGLDEYTELSLFGVEGGQAAALRLVDRGVTGIICGSDLMALGAVRAIRERGLSVPGDVSVIGYDDSALIPFTDPPLTTLRQPIIDISKAAVRALLEGINGQPTPATEFTFRPELVVRASTGPAPA